MINSLTHLRARPFQEHGEQDADQDRTAVREEGAREPHHALVVVVGGALQSQTEVMLTIQ